MSSEEMAKAYEPGAVEARWYPKWEERGYFVADAASEKEPYTIVIPPPNVTGILHIGHVLNNTLQDILIRFEKMRGKETCWVPGTDHAGIATQAKVEAHLLETEGKTKHDLGREEFLKRTWEWKDKYGGTIIKQLRTMGCACDWSRERFTMDEGLSAAVLEVFVRLYDKGLVYRGTRMINWCPKSKTALSDDEVEHQEVAGHLWHIRYPLADGSGEVIVATTRPETMLGDTAVAVNPTDERYTALIGKMVKLPLTDREIPIIADDWAKAEFGSGAVKVTPAHDPNDYAIGQRHDLPMIQILNKDGSMNAAAGEDFVGMDRYECREAVIERLREAGLLVKTEAHTHQVGYSQRGYVPVEPMISEQWFVDMKTLAKPALEAVNTGKIRFYPERWVKTYNYWLENVQDWCISRQLWWGHRIPVWYGPDRTAYCAASEEAVREKYSLAADVPLTQDPDVLDTWFSSWLWPFSVFGWPNQTADLKRFYATQTLSTAPDIIFFWVARMIMAGIECMDEIPFKDVYFHSLVRDKDGRKMSKTLGNSPDPLDIIAEYGADALRYTLIYQAPIGTDIRFDKKDCELGRNFATKLWNAARFRTIQGSLSEGWQDLSDVDTATLRPDDRWILARLDAVTAEATAALEKFDFHAYALAVYEFTWNQFCDWYVESAKSAFYGDDAARKASTLRVFDHVYNAILRLMHPAMPFVTEEIYHALGYVDEADSIMLATWPVSRGVSEDEEAMEALVDEKFTLVSAGRTMRATYNIPNSQKIPYFIKPTDSAFGEMLASDPASVRGLLNAETVTIDADYAPSGLTPSAVGKHGLVYLPLAGLIDLEAEVKRQSKERDVLAKSLHGLIKKLDNPGFLAKAPADVVEFERARQVELTEKLERVNALLADLQQG